jgi:quinolinate synthase
VKNARAAHPGALVLVHPEVRPEVAELADFIGSTSQIIEFASKADATEMIIGTEMGTLHKLYKDNPGKKFYLLSPGLICPNMKRTTLDLIRDSLATLEPRVTIDEQVRSRAVRALERMVEIG